jgi:hypothetical protein
MFTAGSVIMEEEPIQKTNQWDAQNPEDELGKGSPPPGGFSDRRTNGRKALGWGVWVLIFLIGFLLMSNIASLVVSQRAYESSQKQAKAIEQMTQSIKDVQKSIMNLSTMIEQPPPEDEEHEDDRGNGVAGADSI